MSRSLTAVLASLVALATPLHGCAHPSPLAAAHREPAPPPRYAEAEGLATASDGVKLRYVSAGAGPAVMLLHCWGCSLEYWDAAARALATDHRVVRMDLAGHGRSGTDRARYSIEQWVADVRAVADDAGLARFTIVGHSMSGPIALESAIAMPGRVTGVVPVDAFLAVERGGTPSARQAFLAKLRADFRGTTETIVRSLLRPESDRALVDRILRDELAQDPSRAAAYLEPSWLYASAEGFDRLEQPIVAVESDLTPVDLAGNRRHAPQFDAKIVAGTGHWLMLERPAPFASALREAVRLVESGEAPTRTRALAAGH
jgi:pimeloyl-ACP methyl ester carboxylesterase